MTPTGNMFIYYVTICRALLCVDDDDIPVGDNWIAEHAKNYIDPLCIGVSGRHIHQLNEVSRYNNIKGGVGHAYERCLTISFMGRGRVFTGINTVKKPVEWLHGNNCSIRKSCILNLGGWYPFIQGLGEEHSLYFKLTGRIDKVSRLITLII